MIDEPGNEHGAYSIADDEFSVCQFFQDETYEYVRRNVSDKEAMDAFKFYTTNVSARLGLTTRVIITDKGDECNAEWVFGKGITFPTQEQINANNSVL